MKTFRIKIGKLDRENNFELLYEIFVSSEKNKLEILSFYIKEYNEIEKFYNIQFSIEKLDIETYKGEDEKLIN
jgi:hypothetical protein